jgi:hypothetical protein
MSTRTYIKNGLVYVYDTTARKKTAIESVDLGQETPFGYPITLAQYAMMIIDLESGAVIKDRYTGVTDNYANNWFMTDEPVCTETYWVSKD